MALIDAPDREPATREELVQAHAARVAQEEPTERFRDRLRGRSPADDAGGGSGPRVRPVGMRAVVGKRLPSPMLAGFAEFASATASPKQVRRMTNTIQRFLWVDPPITRPRQITAARVQGYVVELERAGRGPATVRNHLTALSRFCRFLVTRQLLPANPCLGLKTTRPEKTPLHWLDDSEIEQVLEIAQARGFWPEVCLALSTGLHLSELIGLEWADINLGQHWLTAGDSESKSHGPRIVPLSGSALAALQAQQARTCRFAYVFPARQTWRDHCGYVNRRRAINWWSRALQPIKATVPKFRVAGGYGWGLLRHTFAARAVREGVSLTTVARWLGHSDVRKACIYAPLQAGGDEQIEAAAPLRREAERKRKGARDDGQHLQTKG